MSLFIQDPNDPECPFVLGAILDACKVATIGGGAFAFVTPEGVKLLLGSDVFRRFLSTSSFELVIGLDGITTPAALKAIGAVEKEFPTLKARAFLPDQARTTFHPKFCWFRTKSGGVVVTGSGNMTRGGFLMNVEAFDFHEISAIEIGDIQKRWHAFQGVNAHRLKPLTDPEVLKHAEANLIVQKQLAPVISDAQKKAGVRVRRADKAESAPLRDDAVLLAEIPKASTRWNQANFDLKTFVEFFGASTDKAHNISLFHIDEKGKPGHEEVRPSVAVKSQNYRFELEAAAGLAYPAKGRPIGVFVRVAPSAFRYRLLMPGDPGHDRVERYLTKIASSVPGRMRRVVVTTKDLKREWPESPLWVAAH